MYCVFAIVALVEQLVAGQILPALAGERHKFKLGRLHFGEQGDVAQDLHFFGQAHGWTSWLAFHSAAISSCSAVPSRFATAATTMLTDRMQGGLTGGGLFSLLQEAEAAARPDYRI
jgi:hypothetical protein